MLTAHTLDYKFTWLACLQHLEGHTIKCRGNTSTADETKFLDWDSTPWHWHAAAASVWWCNFFPLQTVSSMTQIMLIYTWTPGGTVLLLVTLNWAGPLAVEQARCGHVQSDLFSKTCCSCTGGTVKICISLTWESTKTSILLHGYFKAVIIWLLLIKTALLGWCKYKFLNLVVWMTGDVKN